MPHLAARPVRRPPQPHYPTRLDVQTDPDLLARHVPSAWLGRSELAGALGLMLALNSSGCTSDSPDRSPGQKQDARTPAVVAPIFEHGNGNTGIRVDRGMLGCIAVAAPVYLSEEEALGVIRDELGKAGLNSFYTNVEMPDLIIDGSVQEWVHDWSAGHERPRNRKTSAPLQVDLRDPVRNINIEFVSENEFGPLGGDWNGKYYDDLKQAASALSAQVQRKSHDMRFAAFYDPITYGSCYPDILPYGDEKKKDADEDKTVDVKQEGPLTNKQAKSKSKRLLRLQVQDFVNWLKAQGAM